MKTTVNDIEVTYRVEGDGQPCVLIHGLAEDHRSWAGVQAALTGVSSYAMDLRGHGETTPGKGDGTLEQLANDLIGFLENVTGQAICVGFSLGGTIVLKAAQLRPDLFKRAVVVGTSSKVGRAAVGFFETRIASLGSDRAAFDADFRDDTRAQIARELGALDEVVKWRLQAVGDGAGYANAARAMIAMADTPLTPILSNLTVPVSVIGGEKDAFCPRKAAEIILAELPEADFTEIPDAGHMMSVDQPQKYAAAIQRAIKK